MVLALGVSLSSAASAQTVIPSGNTTYNLNPANNPFLINSGTTRTSAVFYDAIYGSNATPWTLTNNGSVTGNQSSGVHLQSQGTVTNAGSITGTNNFGIYLQGGGIVTNRAGGVIRGWYGGVYFYRGPLGADTVTNAGTITATNPNSIGVFLGGGGSVTNQAGGVINGGNVGVSVVGNGATVTNAGTITGGNQIGVVLGSGTVTNQAGGVISANYRGVVITGRGTVTNAGSITGTNNFGIYLQSGGSVTNQAGGVIRGGNIGVYSSFGSSATNQAGGVISGGNIGVYSRGPGTVTNAGTITGGTNSVRFEGNGPHTLILQTGSVLNGTASSTTPAATSALILQGTGTANNNFINFNTLDVQASGTWTLGGASTIGGTVTVESGVLAVTGSLSSTNTLTANAGGTLGGTGTLATTNGVFINAGGAVQGGVPGTIGALQVNGNLTFNSGSFLATVITPSGTNSLVKVGNAATLTGGTVQVTASSLFTHTQTFTILTANTINGAFSSASLVGTAFARNPRLAEDAHDVFLTVDSGSFAAVLPTSATLNQVNSATLNQVNIAKAIDNGLASSGMLPAGFLALGNLPVTNLPNALTQLSGENATGNQQTTFGAMTQFLGTLLDPFVGGRGEASSPASGATGFAEEGEASAYAADSKKRSKSERDAYAAVYTKALPTASFEQRWSVWAAGFGGSQTTDGNTTLGSNGATSRIYGTAVGADYRFSPYTIAGFALAGGGTNFSVANALGTGRSDLFQAGAYVRHTVGPAYISGALAYGWQDITTDRTVTVAGLDRLHAEFNANAFSGRVESGYRFVTPWTGGIGLTPYAAGQFTTFDLPAYAESVLAGTNAFALAYGSKSVTDSRSELGLRTDKSFAMQSGVLTLRGRLAWAHDYNPDRTIAATFQALPGASFVVGGAAQAGDSALTTASAEMKWINGWSAAATFEGEFSNVTRSYAGKGVVRYTW
ncbi:Uncharacterized conserved protein, contains a C-terminal beta-barrel porin domain [Bradyrhizobium lablabi]|uniref:Uncharacterized conserved protein, contains a C-terminal beta-barrel porin domain n=1 Tax=Bradyrhizobium lablabi TaxID=722472 RepID=A0A1M7F642_9BRAD|nr:autotransporter outer membrane beta-barrel domain-containing protein [Bradyrhizobium lablabi]SHL99443.1 Uncharacterized conserved protein, contains a C-terminal beta-barrel porin domain [Bradyrhizobium lablabi]